MVRASTDWFVMSSVPHLFATPLQEAWEDLLSLAPSEAVQQVRQSPGIVSEKKILPPSSHYKQKWIEKNVKSPLPGDSGSKSSARRSALQNNFFSLMLSQALRIRNDYFHKHRQDLDDETLFDALWEYVPEAMAELEITTPISNSYDMAMNGETSSRYWLEHDNISRFVRNAMASSAEKWSAKKIPDLHAAASRGGKGYKTYDLDSHLSTHHMRPDDAAQALGVSRRTIFNMRREFADIDPTTGELRGEQETTEAATGNGAVESDRVRSEAGDGSSPLVDELARALTHRRSRQDLDALIPKGVDDEAGGLLHELDKIPLPF